MTIKSELIKLAARCITAEHIDDPQELAKHFPKTTPKKTVRIIYKSLDRANQVSKDIGSQLASIGRRLWPTRADISNWDGIRSDSEDSNTHAIYIRITPEITEALDKEIESLDRGSLKVSRADIVRKALYEYFENHTADQP